MRLSHSSAQFTILPPGVAYVEKQEDVGIGPVELFDTVPFNVTGFFVVILRSERVVGQEGYRGQNQRGKSKRNEAGEVVILVPGNLEIAPSSSPASTCRKGVRL